MPVGNGPISAGSTQVANVRSAQAPADDPEQTLKTLTQIILVKLQDKIADEMTSVRQQLDSAKASGDKGQVQLLTEQLQSLNDEMEHAPKVAEQKARDFLAKAHGA